VRSKQEKVRGKIKINIKNTRAKMIKAEKENDKMKSAEQHYRI